jgi:hypothetical protein
MASIRRYSATDAYMPPPAVEDLDDPTVAQAADLNVISVSEHARQLGAKLQVRCAADLRRELACGPHANTLWCIRQRWLGQIRRI